MARLLVGRAMSESFWESIPWAKVLPLVAAAIGVAGGVGGTDLYRSGGDESRRAAWQALHTERATLVESYAALRLQCEARLDEVQQRNEALLERVLACE